MDFLMPARMFQALTGRGLRRYGWDGAQASAQKQVGKFVEGATADARTHCGEGGSASNSAEDCDGFSDHGERLRSRRPIRTRVREWQRGHVGDGGDGALFEDGSPFPSACGWASAVAAVGSAGSSWLARCSLAFAEGLKIP